MSWISSTPCRGCLEAPELEKEEMENINEMKLIELVWRELALALIFATKTDNTLCHLVNQCKLNSVAVWDAYHIQ